MRKSKCQRGAPGRLAQTQSNIVFFIYLFFLGKVCKMFAYPKKHMVATSSGLAVGLKKAGRKKISVNK